MLMGPPSLTNTRESRDQRGSLRREQAETEHSPAWHLESMIPDQKPQSRYTDLPPHQHGSRQLCTRPCSTSTPYISAVVDSDDKPSAAVALNHTPELEAGPAVAAGVRGCGSRRTPAHITACRVTVDHSHARRRGSISSSRTRRRPVSSSLMRRATSEKRGLRSPDPERRPPALAVRMGSCRGTRRACARPPTSRSGCARAPACPRTWAPRSRFQDGCELRWARSWDHRARYTTSLLQKSWAKSIT